MSPIERTVAAMRVNMMATVTWQIGRSAKRLVRAAKWAERQDAYERVARLTGDPQMTARAEALSVASRRRAMAWHALACMDAHEAAGHRTQALKARAMCIELTARVWGGGT